MSFDMGAPPMLNKQRSQSLSIPYSDAAPDDMIRARMPGQPAPPPLPIDCKDSTRKGSLGTPRKRHTLHTNSSVLSGISKVQRQHEQYMLDLTGLQPARDSIANARSPRAKLSKMDFAMNITGLPDPEDSVPPSPRLESYQRKLTRYSDVISKQRTQMSRLVLHCQRLERHIAKRGQMQEFHFEQLHSAAVQEAPPVVKFVLADNEVTDSPEMTPGSIRRQSKLMQQLDEANEQIHLLHGRVNLLVECLKETRSKNFHIPKTARSTGDAKRWFSGVKRNLVPPLHPSPGNRQSKVETTGSSEDHLAEDNGEGEIEVKGSLFPRALVSTIAALSMKPEVKHVITEASHIMAKVTKANHVTIFLIDELQNVLYSIASNYLRKGHVVRIPVGEGITGGTALSKEPISLVNASRDPRHNKVLDGMSRALLCVPIVHPYDNAGKVIGLIQLADKSDRRYFTPKEQSIVQLFASFLSLRMVNDELRVKSLKEQVKFRDLFRSAEALMRVQDVSSVVKRITGKIGMFIEADYAMLLAIDRDNKDLVQVGSYSKNEAALRIPGAFKRSNCGDDDSNRIHMIGPGLVCRAVKSGKCIAIGNTVVDRHYNSTYDEFLVDVKSNGATQSVLFQPVHVAPTGRTVAIIVMGKRRKHAFTQEDVSSLKDFLDLIAVAVLRLQAWRHKAHKLYDNLGTIQSLLDHQLATINQDELDQCLQSSDLVEKEVAMPEPHT